MIGTSMQKISTYALEPLYLSHQHLLCAESKELLNEGMKEMVVDAVQFIIGAIGEYGLAATVAGAPAGPVLETLTDSLFAAESVASTLAAVDNIVEAFGELKILIQKIMSLTLEAGFAAFYDQVLDVWASIETLLPDASADKLEELIDKGKEALEGIITKFSDFIGDAVKLIIPEATVGTVVGEGLQRLLMKLAENAYSALTTIVEQLGEYQQIVTDPDYAINLFNTLFDGVEELLDKLQAKMEEEPEGVVDTLSSIGATIADPSSIAKDMVAEKALSLFRDFLVDRRPAVMDLVDKITRILFPAIFALLASYQILMKGEWKNAESSDEEGEPAAKQEPGSVEALLAAGHYRQLSGITEVVMGGPGVPQQVGYGKNYHTLNPEPITWENLEGPEYFVTSQADGTCLAGVSLPGTQLSTPTYKFGDEASAMSWVRNTFDKFRRESMAAEN